MSASITYGAFNVAVLFTLIVSKLLHRGCAVIFLSALPVCVLAESEEIQELLRDLGIMVQTVSEVLPIRVMPARILSHIYVRLGKIGFY